MWMRHSKNGFRRPSMLYPFSSRFSIFNDVRTMLLYLSPYDWYIYRCETRPFRLKFPSLLFLTPTTASAQFETNHLQFTRKKWENRTYLFSRNYPVQSTIYLVINRPKWAMYKELIPFMAETYLIITHKTDPLESKAKKMVMGFLKEETTIGLCNLVKYILVC